jgi:3-carboxy-cis,cis-muconate cycloisomerase
MLAFEAALARAEARAGLIPAAAAEAIAAACRVEHFDVLAIFRDAEIAGTPVIPLVRMLSERVVNGARSYVHWGATSQDAIDSALALQMRAGLDAILDDLLRVCAACATLAERHRSTPMAARTLLQQALPMTFGLKAARWLALTVRQAKELRERRSNSLALQFGGAAGTLAVLDDAGIVVAELLAEELGLRLPELPWHAERDRVALLAAALGVTAGAMAKIAHDIVLLAQTEVSEASEAPAPNKGGSSAMPQKRNPVDATLALASARLAIGAAGVLTAGMAHEHERAVGGWQAEWAAIPEVFRATAGAVARVADAVAGLQIDEQRMRTNLEFEGGLLMSEALLVTLASRVGRPEAQRLVQVLGTRVRAEGIPLGKAAQSDAQIRALLMPEEIEHALDPSAYLGSTGVFIDRALASYRAL